MHQLLLAACSFAHSFTHMHLFTPVGFRERVRCQLHHGEQLSKMGAASVQAQNDGAQYSLSLDLAVSSTMMTRRRVYCIGDC